MISNRYNYLTPLIQWFMPLESYLFFLKCKMSKYVIYKILLALDLQHILSLNHYENMPIQIYRKIHLRKLKIFK